MIKILFVYSLASNYEQKHGCLYLFWLAFCKLIIMCYTEKQTCYVLWKNSVEWSISSITPDIYHLKFIAIFSVSYLLPGSGKLILKWQYNCHMHLNSKLVFVCMWAYKPIMILSSFSRHSPHETLKTISAAKKCLQIQSAGKPNKTLKTEKCSSSSPSTEHLIPPSSNNCYVQNQEKQNQVKNDDEASPTKRACEMNMLATAPESNLHTAHGSGAIPTIWSSQNLSSTHRSVTANLLLPLKWMNAAFAQPFWSQTKCTSRHYILAAQKIIWGMLMCDSARYFQHEV